MAEARDQAIRARGERIAAARKARGWSQEDLAGKLGVGVGTVSRWERGLHAGYPENNRELAEALGIPIAEVVPTDGANFLDQLNEIQASVARLETLIVGFLIPQVIAQAQPRAPRAERPAQPSAPSTDRPPQAPRRATPAGSRTARTPRG